jgi:DNA-binding XRE family transcriptional regulator
VFPKELALLAQVSAADPNDADMRQGQAKAERTVELLELLGFQIVRADGGSMTRKMKQKAAAIVAALHLSAVDDRTPLGQRLRHARKSQGVSQAKLAAALRIKQPSVVAYEKSENVSEQTIRKVARALGMTLGEVLEL